MILRPGADEGLIALTIEAADALWDVSHQKMPTRDIGTISNDIYNYLQNNCECGARRSVEDGMTLLCTRPVGHPLPHENKDHKLGRTWG